MDIFRWLFNSIFNTSEAIGRRGENRTAGKLDWVDFCGRKGKVLQNVYLPRPNGGTSEIDLLYVTQKGVFVIESKNYSGYIFGNEKNRNWTSTLYAGKDWLGRKKVEKHQFYNPIWQNNSHIKALQQYIGIDIQTFSIIVFSDRCSFKSLTYSTPDVVVCHRHELPQAIRTAWKNYPNSLSVEEINALYKKLSPLTNQDKAAKNRHVHDIHNRMNNIDICPVCGGKLVLRTARRGDHAGEQFYGCSSYPKCKYIKNL